MATEYVNDWMRNNGGPGWKMLIGDGRKTSSSLGSRTSGDSTVVSSGSSSPYSYDDRRSAANLAKDYASKAESTLTGVSDEIRGSLDGILSGTDISNWLSLAGGSYEAAMNAATKATDAANGITNVTTKVNEQAGQIANVAESIGEYEPLLREMGETMFGEGGELVGSGNEYIKSGLALLGLDKSAGGLSGTYARVLAMLDPSLAVSLAANDTRSAFETQAAATERAAARRGVSAGSGQSEATMQQAGQALATSLAAIKTKTRLNSAKEYLSAIRGAVADANALGSTGSSIVGQGVSAQTQGANATKAAADVLSMRSNAHGQAASAYGTVGQLLAAQANAYNAAGSLANAAGGTAVAAANAQTGASNTQVSAYNLLLQAETNTAQYYASLFNNYATIAEEELFRY